MKKPLILSIGALALAAALPALAAERQFAGTGHAACLSEDLLDQLVSAAVDNDNRAIDYLMSNGCFVPREGVPVSVIRQTFTGKAHVRAYLGDQAIELWTLRDALTEQ